MSDAIDVFRNILKNEIKRGYDNKSVFGGLDKIREVFFSTSNPHLSQKLIKKIESFLSEYPIWDINQRKESIESLLAELPSESINSSNSATPHFIQNALTPLSDDTFFAPLEILRGVGPQTAKVMRKIGIVNLRDLLSHYPRRYEDFSQLKTINHLHAGETATIIAKVLSIYQRESKQRRMNITEAIISDSTGSLRTSWFNQPWLRNQLAKGKDVVVSGKIGVYLGRLSMSNPEWEEVEKEHLHTNRIVPIYSSSTGLSQKYLRRIIYKSVDFWSSRIKDPLPDWILIQENLMSFSSALFQIHFPDNQENLTKARERLSFDEILMLQIAIFQQKRIWANLRANSIQVSDDELKNSIESLPFNLTSPQVNAIQEIRHDISLNKPMHRLIQGDVGSGKTVVAAIAAEHFVKNGTQTAFMAPTSILAEQHFRTLQSLMIDRKIMHPHQIALLLGDTPARQKKDIYKRIASGEVLLIIGTHALFQTSVEFSKLQLIVIDEQHRFGVSQRALLREKAKNPHVLVLTATPIPRSLALTLYGDLDISIIDELPSGRKKIETILYSPTQRNKAYTQVLEQIRLGHQAFFVYPLIEEEDEDSRKAVVGEVKRLQREVFPSHKVELLHGRMRTDEKEKVLSSFRNGDVQILVSTTVIEVGMDIPNATIVVIESANRFGLAQLHQIRGRVGRSDAQSYCILIPENEETVENDRLKIMVNTNNGFDLAEFDLQHRGPGDFLGKRQSGFWGMKLTNIADVKMIERARKIANEIMQRDPELQSVEYSDLRYEVNRAIPEHFGEIS